MPRAFTDADLVPGQFADGSSASAATLTVSLPAGTTEGNTGIAVIKAQTSMASPDIWDKSADTGAAGGLVIFTRPGLTAGENDWVFNSFSGSPQWVWRAEEWTNVSLSAVASSAITVTVNAPTTLSSGTSGSVDVPFVMCVAAFVLQRGTAGASSFPAFSAFSNGFVEVPGSPFDFGTGPASGDMRMAVARYYGTENETGPFECTATVTGVSTNFIGYAAIAVLRATDDVEVPAPIIMTSGGGQP